MNNPKETHQKILFLCTGNYYRSRFAEALFNHHAEKTRTLRFRANSLGFTPHPKTNPGAISPYTSEALLRREIELPAPIRMPAAVREEDFLRHECCIALSESEHRPMMQRMFPQFVSRVRFWQVEDLAWENPENAIRKIEAGVHQLLEEFDRYSVTSNPAPQ